jgi:hypothetical protein
MERVAGTRRGGKVSRAGSGAIALGYGWDRARQVLEERKVFRSGHLEEGDEAIA